MTGFNYVQFNSHFVVSGPLCIHTTFVSIINQYELIAFDQLKSELFSKARIVILVDLREFISDLGSGGGGRKKNI